MADNASVEPIKNLAVTGWDIEYLLALLDSPCSAVHGHDRRFRAEMLYGSLLTLKKQMIEEGQGQPVESKAVRPAGGGKTK